MQSNAADSLFRTKMNTSPLTHSHHVDKIELDTAWTASHSIQSPMISNDIQSLYLHHAMPSQDHVSPGYEATADVGCSASHLRCMLQAPNFGSTASVQQLTDRSYMILQYPQVIQDPRPCSFNNSFLTQEIKHQIKNQVQGAVRWDLVKVNDPSLKKAPPVAVEFGSDGPSCHASTLASAKFRVLS